MDELVQFLIEEVAMDGEQGTGLDRLGDHVQAFYKSQAAGSGAQLVDDAFIAFVWDALLSQDEISLGVMPLAAPAQTQAPVASTSSVTPEPEQQQQQQGNGKKKKTKNSSRKEVIKAPDMAKPDKLSSQDLALGRQALMAKYGNRLRVFADSETIWVALTGSHDRPSTLTGPVYTVIQLASRRRGEGQTVVELTAQMPYDGKSMYHFVKQAVNLGIVEKFHTFTAKQHTNRVVHKRFLHLSDEYQLLLKEGKIKRDEGGDDEGDEVDDGGAADEAEGVAVNNTTYTPRDLLNMRSPVLIRQIVEAVRNAPMEEMRYNEITAAVGLVGLERKALRVFHAICRKLIADGMIEKVDHEVGYGIRIGPAAASSAALADGDADESDGERHSAPAPLYAHIPVERQIIDAVEGSGLDGIASRELENKLGGISARTLDTLLERWEECGAPDEWADLSLHNAVDQEGRMKLIRFFTLPGYTRLLKASGMQGSSANLDPHEDRRHGFVPEPEGTSYWEDEAHLRKTMAAALGARYGGFSDDDDDDDDDDDNNNFEEVHNDEPSTSKGKKGKGKATAGSKDDKDQIKIGKARATTQKPPDLPQTATASTSAVPAQRPRGRPKKLQREVTETAVWKMVDGVRVSKKTGNPIRLDANGKPLRGRPPKKRDAESEYEDGPPKRKRQRRAAAKPEPSAEAGVEPSVEPDGVAPNTDGTASATASPPAGAASATPAVAPNVAPVSEPATTPLNAAQSTSATAEPPKKRGRPRKHPLPEPNGETTGEAPAKRPRGRPRKSAPPPDASAECSPAPVASTSAAAEAPDAPIHVEPAPAPPKRPRGRPRKSTTEASAKPSSALAASTSAAAVGPTSQPSFLHVAPSPISQPHVDSVDTEGDYFMVDAEAHLDEGGGVAPTVASAQSQQNKDLSIDITLNEPGTDATEPATPGASVASRIQRGAVRQRVRKRKDRISVAGATRAQSVLHWIRDSGGVIDRKWRPCERFRDWQSEHNVEASQHLMDLNVMNAVLDSLVQDGSLREVSIELGGATRALRRPVLYLPELALDGDEFARFREGYLGPKPGVQGGRTKRQGRRPKASREVAPDADTDRETLQRYFSSDSGVMADRHGRIQGVVWRARYLHERILEYLDAQGLLDGPDAPVISARDMITSLTLGHYLKIFPAPREDREVDSMLANETCQQVHIKDLPGVVAASLRIGNMARRARYLAPLLGILEGVGALECFNAGQEGAAAEPETCAEWRIKRAVPIYNYTKEQPDLYGVAEMSNVQSPGAFWDPMRQLSLRQLDDYTPVGDDRFPSQLEKVPARVHILTQAAKWSALYHLHPTQREYLQQIIQTLDGDDEVLDDTKLDELADDMRAPRDVVQHYLEARKLAANAERREQPLRPRKRLTAVEQRGKDFDAIVSNWRRNNDMVEVENVDALHWLKEKFVDNSGNFDVAKLEAELTFLVAAQQGDRSDKTLAHKPLTPQWILEPFIKDPDAPRDTTKKPARRGGPGKKAPASGPTSMSTGVTVVAAPPAPPPPPPIEYDEETLNELLVADDPASNRKRKHFTPEMDELLLDFITVMRVRTQRMGRIRTNWGSLSQLFPGQLVSNLRVHATRVMDRTGMAAYLAQMQRMWDETVESLGTALPDPNPKSLEDFPVKTYIKVLRERVDKNTARLLSLRTDDEKDVLPEDIAELLAMYRLEDAPFVRKSRGFVAKEALSNELRATAFAVPVVEEREDNVDAALARAATKLVLAVEGGCDEAEAKVIFEPFNSLALGKAKNDLEAQHVIRNIATEKTGRGVPAPRKWTVNPTWLDNFNEDLLPDVEEVEQAISKLAIEAGDEGKTWPNAVDSDDEMVALFALVAEGRADFEVDISVTAQQRQAVRYNTRKTEDYDLENAITVKVASKPPAAVAVEAPKVTLPSFDSVGAEVAQVVGENEALGHLHKKLKAAGPSGASLRELYTELEAEGVPLGAVDDALAHEPPLVFVGGVSEPVLISIAFVDSWAVQHPFAPDKLRVLPFIWATARGELHDAHWQKARRWVYSKLRRHPGLSLSQLHELAKAKAILTLPELLCVMRALLKAGKVTLAADRAQAARGIDDFALEMALDDERPSATRLLGDGVWFIAGATPP